jgi:pimeloyl-ACP methyl ester carboxylesterase
MYKRTCIFTKSWGRIFWTVAMTFATQGFAQATPTKACRVPGFSNEVQCGKIERALNPAQPDGPKVDIHYVVVPAMARNKQPDAVLVLAGGPGQSAIGIAAAVMPRLRRLNNRRDLVFIDQRGTGRSAPLQCPDESSLPLAQAMDPAQQLQRLRLCSQALAKLPYGDLRFFTTTLAMQDFDAVRVQINVPRWNLIGASYGTRAALDYLRQFPYKVRRTVIDGVAPPDMVLPRSMSSDTQAALERLFVACEADTQDQTSCAKRFPNLRQEWAQLLQSLPRTIQFNHPTTGLPETLDLSRDAVLRMVRAPLYVPSLASGLAAALHAAKQGRFQGLIGLSAGMGEHKANRLAMGMHFSVVCAEDVQRLGQAAPSPGADFGGVDADLYTKVCSFWPKGAVDDAFYTVPVASTPVLLLSGGADPVTPPRHGERMAKALGAQTQHIVVPEAGHGISGIGCMRDVIERFIAAPQDSQALPQNADCATRVPRPKVFLPMEPGIVAGAAS